MEETVECEETYWGLVSDDLYNIRSKPKGPDRDAVRRSLIRKLRQTLREELAEARTEM